MKRIARVTLSQTNDRHRRIYIPGSSWFFTVNLAERRNNHLLAEKIDLLRTAFRYVKERKPYRIDAIVIMPDHLHSTAWMQEVEHQK